MKLTILALALTFAASPVSPPPVFGGVAQEAKRPAFTLVSRLTVISDKGQSVWEVTRYVSANGGVREVSRREGASEQSEFIYERGRGGFFVDRQKQSLRRRLAPPPEVADEPAPTAESLRSHPNFTRTEQLLGYTTYVIRETAPHNKDFYTEHYFAPEFGRTALKEVRYDDGKIYRMTEPLSAALGEPDAALMILPADYRVLPAAPISGGVLNGKAVSKPAPDYPAEAKAAGAQGTVTVQITVAEDGTVESAQAVSGHPLLREAAVEAARRARFSQTRLSGQPVKVTGVVTYNFVLR